MRHPMSRSNDRRPRPGRGIGDPHAVGRHAESDLLRPDCRSSAGVRLFGVSSRDRRNRLLPVLALASGRTEGRYGAGELLVLGAQVLQRTGIVERTLRFVLEAADQRQQDPNAQIIQRFGMKGAPSLKSGAARQAETVQEWPAKSV